MIVVDNHGKYDGTLQDMMNEHNISTECACGLNLYEAPECYINEVLPHLVDL